MNTTDANDKRMFGVWQPGIGWLRGSEVFADYDYEKAKQVARLVGNNSVVRFIDKSIVDLEDLYLRQEGRSLWLIFKNYLARNSNK